MAETNQPNISTDTKGISETRDNADSRKQRGCVRPVLQDVVSLNLITELFTVIGLGSAEGRQPESKIPGGGHTGQATISCQM